jgi:hypothetical protein
LSPERRSFIAENEVEGETLGPLLDPGTDIGDRVGECLLTRSNVQPVEVARGDDRRNPPQRDDLRRERIVEGARRVDEKLAAPELDQGHARVELGAAQSHAVPPQPERIGNEDFEGRSHSQHLQQVRRFLA